MGTVHGSIDVQGLDLAEGDRMAPAQQIDARQVQVLDALPAQVDMFGALDAELTLDEVKKAIRGVSRPRDLRPLIMKSSHDPLMNMLEIAMAAKNAGELQTAFERFAEVLPYVWTKVLGGAAGMPIPGQPGAPASGEVVYRWATPTDQA